MSSPSFLFDIFNPYERRKKEKLREKNFVEDMRTNICGHVGEIAESSENSEKF